MYWTFLSTFQNEIRAADDKAKKATMDNTRLSEELHSEQAHASQTEKMRKSLESQVKDLQVRLDEAEASALKGGKKVIAKLESRVS